jgi:multiple sugar transport system substrate-binding protein
MSDTAGSPSNTPSPDVSRRKFLQLGAVGAAALGLSGAVAACGGSSGTKSGNTAAPAGTGNAAAPSGARGSKTTVATGTVTVWCQSGLKLQEVAKNFEAENPGLSIQVSEFPTQTLHDKIVASFAGGGGPDCTVVPNQDLGDFANLGGLAALDDFKSSFNFKDADFCRGVWENLVYKDHQYGIPAYTEIRALFYRTDLFQAAGIASPPKTLDEFRTVGKQLSNGTDRFGCADQTGQLDLHFAAWLVYEMGGDFYSADRKKATVTSPETLKGLEYYQNLYLDNIIPKDPGKRADPWSGFQQGLYAMAESGGFWFPKLQAASSLAGKWDIAPLPAGPANVQYGHAQPWVIPAKAKNRAGAEAWIAYMLTPKAQADWFELHGLAPSVLAAYDDPRLAKNAPLVSMRDDYQQAAVNSVFNVPNGETITTRIFAATSSLKNGADLQKTASTLNSQIDELLNS